MNRWSVALLMLLVVADAPFNSQAFVPAGLASRRNPFLMKPLHSYLDSLSNNDRSDESRNNGNGSAKNNFNAGLGRGSFSNTTTTSSSSSSYAVPDPTSTSTTTSTIEAPEEPRTRFQSYTDSLSSSNSNSNSAPSNSAPSTVYPNPPQSQSPLSSFDEEDLQQQKQSFVDVNAQQQQHEENQKQGPTAASVVELTDAEDYQQVMEIQEDGPVSTNSFDQPPIEVEIISTTSKELNGSSDAGSADSVNVGVSLYSQEIEREATTLPDVSLSEADIESIPIFSKEEEEEGVASIIASTLASSLSVTTSRSYLASRVSLQESKNKNEKRMSRSVYEIEKTQDAISEIRLRAQEQIQRAEKQLEDKLNDIQNNLDDEIERITTLLKSQVEFEKKREENLVKLIWTLQSAKISKEEDIAADDKTTGEMIELRNKMEDSTISSQLDVVIAQKQALGAINRCQVDDLNDILDEAQSIVKETRALITLVYNTLDQVVPLTAGDKLYEFSDLEKLQRVWKDASNRIDEAEVRMKALKNKYDNDRLNKLMLLGEPVPPSLQKVVKKIEAEMKGESMKSSETRMIAPSQESSTTQIIPSSKNIIQRTHSQEDLSTKDESELIGVLAMSVGKAAIASAKAGVFGVKALLETISDKEVTGITEDAIKKSAGISKVSSGLTESIKSINSVKSKDDLKNVVSTDLKSGIESTGETLNAFGKAGKAIVNKVTLASSASQASDALRETSDDLIQAFNAITALSKKSSQQNRDKNRD